MLRSVADTHFIKVDTWGFSGIRKFRPHLLSLNQPRRTMPPGFRLFQIFGFHSSRRQVGWIFNPRAVAPWFRRHIFMNFSDSVLHELFVHSTYSFYPMHCCYRVGPAKKLHQPWGSSATRARLTSLDKIKAARSSSLGIVCCARGATLVLLMTSRVQALLHVSILRYTTAVYATSELSPNQWIWKETTFSSELGM